MNWRALIQYLGLIGVNYTLLKKGTHPTLLTVVWGVYLEMAVGGVLFRPNSKGGRDLQLLGITNQLVWPLTDYNAWRPDFWDLNFYTVAGGTAL